jgi:hypothetical protein
MSAAATAAGYLYAAGRLRGRGTKCGDKNTYSSEGEALQNAVHRTGKGAPALRAYRCQLCNAWHLTKQVARA